MRKKFLIILLMVFIFSNLAYGKNLKIGHDPWAPYTLDVDSEKPGFSIELLKKIFNEYDLQFFLQPYSRAIVEIDNGNLDILPVVYESDFEGKKAIFSEEEVGISLNSFFVRSDSSWTFTGETSLNNQRIGLIHGYTYYEEFITKYLETNKNKAQYLSGVGNIIERSLEKVILKRIDAYFDDTIVVNYTIKKLKFAGIKEIKTNEEPTPLKIVVSNKNSEASKLVEMFDAKIKEMRKNGELKKILDLYGLNDWK
ncbi:MAG: transporter substrate-binding domain-containing protein [Desulfobacterales bacterium]|nr:transporter substrate-binding domain-containing protein [Desulfobacterales bacterium]